MTITTVESDLNRHVISNKEQKKQQLISLRSLGVYSVRHPSALQAGQKMLEFSNTGYLHIVLSNKGVSFWALLLNCFPVKKCEWLNESEMLRSQFQQSTS